MFASIKPKQLFYNKKPISRLNKILAFPLTRIIIAFAFLLPILILNNLFSILVLDNLNGFVLIITQVIKTIVFIGLLIFSYHLYAKHIEGRYPLEFSFKNWFKEFSTGIIIGGGMVIIITGILFITGSYQIDHLNSPTILFERFFRYAQGAFLEDLVFTIIVFKLLEEQFGTAISFVIVSLFFGGIHLMNDNATLTTSLFISIQQITLIAPFILTRRIWMGWAVHLSWNYFQAGVFGMNNSGMNHGGFITPIINGPNWLTGGSFGIEASLLSLLINLTIGTIIIIISKRQKQIVKQKNKR